MVSPEALTTTADFFVDESLPRRLGEDFDFIIITPGVMDEDFNEKLIIASYFILYLKRNFV